MPAALPDDEPARLSALRSTGVLDTADEPYFDDIARLAALICGTPIALVSLVDERRQWFKARVGLNATETPRDLAFCAHAILEPDQVLDVPDAAEDARFRGNALVTEDPHIRFYAGAPLVLDSGEALGTVCAIDRIPRNLTEGQREALRALSRQAAQMLQWRRAAQAEATSLRDEAKRRHEELQQATAMAAHGLALMSYIDRSHTYRYVNDLYLRYWNVARESIEGRTVRELMGEDAYREAALPHLQRAFRGEMVSYSARFRFPLMGERSMHVNYLPVRNDAGHVHSVVVRAEDIEEFEQVRQALTVSNAQLQDRNQVQQRFIHMLSHDIREPVNTICNFAGLLRRQAAASMDGTAQRSLGFIERGGQRMLTLLDDLQAYLRLEGQDLGLLRVEPVDLQELFRSVCEDLTDAIQRHGAHFQGSDLPTVRGDAALLRLLFQNLLANAMKFHAPGQPPRVTWGARPAEDGVVRVTWGARPAEDGVVVWVRDEGIGMEPDKIQRLFAPFSRLVVRSRFEGTGLGLAICKRVVDLHGGRIEVESAPGRGSTFGVWLPSPQPQGPGAVSGESRP